MRFSAVDETRLPGCDLPTKFLKHIDFHLNRISETSLRVSTEGSCPPTGSQDSTRRVRLESSNPLLFQAIAELRTQLTSRELSNHRCRALC